MIMSERTARPQKVPDKACDGPMLPACVLVLVFASGLAALIYEILWLRECRILLGSTVQASSIVLASFFGGLAMGSSYWGRRAPQAGNLLHLAALLEGAGALSSLLFFSLAPFLVKITPLLASAAGQNALLLLATRLCLGACLILLPAFFMGGTLPLLAEWWTHDRKELGSKVTLLYTVNTAGAALGAFLAGFHLPMLLGYRRTYLAAFGLKVVLCLIYLFLGHKPGKNPSTAASDLRLAVSGPSLKPRFWITLTAFSSGFLTLTLEVLWTHMYAQVLHNSVYTFAVILVTFLIALTLGAGLAHALARTRAAPAAVLCLLLSFSGLFAALSPVLFRVLTGGVQYLPVSSGWTAYILSAFRNVGLTVGLPVLFMGTVFPYLLKVSETTSQPGDSPALDSPGRVTGRLLAFNTLGSIAGSLAAGFVLMPAAGLWKSLQGTSMVYLALALFFRDPVLGASRLSRIPALLSLAVLVLVLPSQGSLPSTLHAERGDELVETWESAYGLTSVVRQKERLQLKSNNSFGLGSDRYRKGRMTMADLPILLHGRPESIFFLGMGTGVTAGSALDHDGIGRMVVAELVPDVITAARKYFSRNHKLFEDERVHIVAEDGRYYLASHRESYDLIISDLFFPWHEGAGNLWTKEHFIEVKKHLKEGGLFAQWLPLYQLTARDFMIIARTMTEVFGEVTFWRRNSNPSVPLGVLIADTRPGPLDADALIERVHAFSDYIKFPEDELSVFPFLHYGGNLSAGGRDILEKFPVNTDDRPWVEFLSPLSYTRAKSGAASWFSGLELAKFSETLIGVLPPEEDPYLARLEPRQKEAVRAGLDFFKAESYRQLENEEAANRLDRSFCERLDLRPCESFIAALKKGSA